MTGVIRVGPVATVWRGVRGRCGRCGGGRVYRGFRLHERCPTCGYRFEREEGFFTGVFLVNFGLTLAVLWGVVMGYTIWRAATDAGSGLTAILLIAVGIGVLLPIVAYRPSLTTWAALDLVLRPLEPEEEAEAAVWVAEEAPEDP